ncbi:MAG TPA: alpha/beta fold hydrolase, partial [Arenimonas sp.]|nr:alpha/beta fold hydrolase [Arenimonas sp.]
MQDIELATARGPLAALRGGDARGPKLLCLHGWLDNAASFLPLAPFLDGFDWVALDLPGHGASAHRAPGYDYAFADWLHDVLDALDALDWPAANLLGHSMGGAIACTLAAAAPARVQRLALVEALGPVAGDPAKAGERLREAVAARRGKPARDPRVMPDVDTAVAARLLATRMTPAAARLIVERNLRQVPGGYAWRSDPRLTWPGHVRMDEATIEAMLRAIQAPVRVVAADPPPAFFPASVRAARLACLRQGSVVELA